MITIAEKQQISTLIGLLHEKQIFRILSSKFLACAQIATENQRKPAANQNKPHRKAQFAAVLFTSDVTNYMLGCN
ncbi:MULTISPECIES: hypothetical protein [unclassified Duganella]|uniref:hypothetical protein n=1 Tax=unclassified Duganella TaxID=2636909 RepID=UPI0011142AB0|nr:MULTISPECIES: hypothetical protein [unclassified Duganella]